MYIENVRQEKNALKFEHFVFLSLEETRLNGPSSLLKSYHKNNLGDVACLYNRSFSTENVCKRAIIVIKLYRSHKSVVEYLTALVVL